MIYLKTEELKKNIIDRHNANFILNPVKKWRFNREIISTTISKFVNPFAIIITDDAKLFKWDIDIGLQLIHTVYLKPNLQFNF